MNRTARIVIRLLGVVVFVPLLLLLAYFVAIAFFDIVIPMILCTVFIWIFVGFKDN